MLVDGKGPQYANLCELVEIAKGIRRVDPEFARNDFRAQNRLSRNDVDNPPNCGVFACRDPGAPS